MSFFRESSVGENATTGVGESAMREVKRQTRTLNFALEGRVGKIVESHSILSRIPMMASDAISFFRIGRDGLTAEKCDVLDVLGRSSLQSFENLSVTVER